MNALHWLIGVFVAAPALLREKKQRGDITLQQVIWAAGIAVAAVAVIAAIVAIINGYVAKIPK